MKKVIITFMLIISVAIVYSQDIQSAKTQINERNYGEAKKTLEKLLSVNKNDAEAHYLLGQSYMGLKDFGKASEEFETAIKINWNNADYHFALGQAYGADAQSSSIFTQMKLAPKIKEEFLNTVKINPNHIRGHLGLIGFYKQAPGFMGGGMDKAYEEVKKLISIDDIRGRYELVKLLIADKNVKRAEEECKYLESKIGNNKEYSSFYNDYGYYLLNNSRVNEAIQKFKKQVELAPNNGNAYDSLGDGYLASGNKTEAIVQFKKALSINPNNEATKKKLSQLNN